ncbi:MAG: tRNA-dihydrouridine synthase family protein [Synergistaceae bacterium]|nr:tRNA-dihydrouridine synthase family protein [Synergistaceae bacterium]
MPEEYTENSSYETETSGAAKLREPRGSLRGATHTVIERARYSEDGGKLALLHGSPRGATPTANERDQCSEDGGKLALWLAPLAGVTIPPVRLFFSRLGAEITHTEMVSASGLLYKNKKTKSMLEILPGESPVVLQLFAGDADSLVRAADFALAVSETNKLQNGAASFYALGINMACPMPKVQKRGAGAKLLEYPEIAFSMVKELKKIGLPVWVKVRKTPQKNCLTTYQFIEGLIEAGADNVCLHGRTPAQRYDGIADKEIVCGIARAFPGKISGSGDVYAHEDARVYLDAGCVGVMAARGALANPFIFRSDPSYPPAKEQLSLLAQFGRDVSELAGPRVAVIMVKRLLAGLLKGICGSGVFRREVARELNYERIAFLIEQGIAKNSVECGVQCH